MLTPYPHQEAGAEFLAGRAFGLLADEPRVGKTGAALLGIKACGAKKVLVVTTASGRAVWHAAVRDWLGGASFDQSAVSYGPMPDKILEKDIVIVGWAAVSSHIEKLEAQPWDAVIVDESHYAKTFDAKRTSALFDRLLLIAPRAYFLTGTPMANGPIDVYPMLSRMTHQLKADKAKGWPDVRGFHAFQDRYCIMRPVRVSKSKIVNKVIAHKNLDELAARLAPVMLRRTQQDVGITEAIYETVPIVVPPADIKKMLREIEEDPKAGPILSSLYGGGNGMLEDEHFGVIRRITGKFKAPGVARLVLDDLGSGLDKIVVMAWHRDTLDTLEYSVRNEGHRTVRVDGSTTPERRKVAETSFRNDPTIRVFFGQIVACGEAIDLSAAADLIFAESSFVPKDMKQASLRITNHTQARQPRVRIAALQGSVDEVVQASVLRKTADISKAMSEA